MVAPDEPAPEPRDDEEPVTDGEAESGRPGSSSEEDQRSSTPQDPAGLARLEKTSVEADEAELQRRLEEGTADLHLLIKVAAWRSPRLNGDPGRRALGERYAPAVAAAIR